MNGSLANGATGAMFKLESLPRQRLTTCHFAYSESDVSIVFLDDDNPREVQSGRLIPVNKPFLRYLPKVDEIASWE